MLYFILVLYLIPFFQTSGIEFKLKALDIKEPRRPTKCICNICKGNTTCETFDYCFASLEIAPNISLYKERKGCTYGSSLSIPIKTFCEFNDQNNGIFVRCCFTDYCNNNLFTELYNHTVSNSIKIIKIYESSKMYEYILPIIFGIILLLTILFCLLLAPLKIYRSGGKIGGVLKNIIHLREIIFTKILERKPRKHAQLLENITDNNLNDCTETLGIGLAWLGKTSIATQIELFEQVGSGRFGQVFRGHWNSQNVAVKILSPISEDNGVYEATIYKKYNLRHENILCFISDDKINKNGLTQMWLIFDYHSNGSLQTYLENHEISKDDYYKIISSVATGLSFLHYEIVGSDHSKPAMAHRDVKTSNILIKNDGYCCISDLGTVLIDNRNQQFPTKNSSMTSPYNLSLENIWKNTIDLESNSMIPNSDTFEYKIVGTKRYLSPELLDDRNICLTFDIIQKADVFAFGYVLWETSLRVKLNGICYNYQLPYENRISTNPEIEEMYQLIVVNDERPEFPNEWEHDTLIKKVKNMIIDCWYKNPDSRPKMAYIKKRLLNIYEEIK